MKKEKLNEILRLHKLWLAGDRRGVRADLSGANLRGADLQGATLLGADLRGANLRGANLRGANLRDVDLRGADLRGADLWGIELPGAILRGADLRGADLRDADLQGTGVVIVQGSRDVVIYTGGDLLSIGCKGYSVAFWLEHYQEIGSANDYSDAEVVEYKCYIDLIAKKAEGCDDERF